MKQAVNKTRKTSKQQREKRVFINSKEEEQEKEQQSEAKARGESAMTSLWVEDDEVEFEGNQAAKGKLQEYRRLALKVAGIFSQLQSPESGLDQLGSGTSTLPEEYCGERATD